jgi:hypothetical protein
VPPEESEQEREHQCDDGGCPTGRERRLSRPGDVARRQLAGLGRGTLA